MRWAAYPITLLLFLPGQAQDIESDQHPMDYVWELADEEQADLALELLESGSDAERRWVAEEAADLLMSLDSDEDDTWAIERMERLRSWMDSEQDDFVLSLVVRGIDDFEEALVGPLFLELLSHPSPNVRREAIGFYTDWGEDPAATPILEQMWESEPRGWIRDDLILALASMGSSRFIDDFIEQARDHDRARAQLAVEALGYLDAPQAVTGLVDLATDRSYPLRVSALLELKRQGESPQVRDTLLAASHDSAEEIRRIAVQAFSVSEEAPEVAARLREIARSDTSPDIRQVALGRLGDDGEVATILRGILDEPRTPRTETLVRYAEQRLAPPPEPDPVFLALLQAERAGEEIDWEGLGYDFVTTEIVCSLTVRVPDQDTPGALALQPDPGRETTRCWRAPGVAADFFVNERIAGGTWVTTSDYHEYRGEPWVELVGNAVVGCWVPLERLGETHDDRPLPSRRDGSTLHEEADLFTCDGSDPVLSRIAEFGTVEFFDPDPESGVEAVAVDVEPTVEAILGLLDSYRGTEDAIDRLVRTLLGKVPPDLELDAELRGRLDALFPAGPRVPHGM